MLISVCLPTYNGSAHVREALSSVLQQRDVEFEVLVSDDCSTDETLEIVAQFAAKDQRIKVWRNEQKLGLFANYNKCLAVARGELIKPIAQDDTLCEETTLLQMANALQNNQGVSLVCVERKIESQIYSPANEDLVPESLGQGRSSGRDVILHCMQSYRNLIGEPVAAMFSAADKDLLFDVSYQSLGDLDLWIRILERGDLFFIQKPLVAFRQHEDSATMSLMKNMEWVSDFYILARKHENYLKELDISVDQYCMQFSDFAGGLIDKLVGEGKLQIDELTGTAAVAYYSLRRCAELSFKSREYDSIVTSTSWRITEPLRSILRKIR